MPDEAAVLETPVTTGASLDTGSAGVETTPVETQPTETVDTTTEQQPVQQEKGEDLSEFGSMVSSRLREYTKKSPELAAAMQKDPNLKNTFEGVFRRDAAYRELFPTVAEAREYREAFPNGMQDVKDLMATVQELETLDTRIADKGVNGEYPGHRDVIHDIWSENRESAVALMRTAIREWPREDSESYNSILSGIIGATFQAEGIPGFVGNLKAIATDIKNPQLNNLIEQLEGWVGGFLQDPNRQQQQSPEAQRLKAEREQIAKERAENEKSSSNQFNQTTGQQVGTMQRGVIEGHPLIKQLAKTVPAEKRGRIVQEIQKRLHEAIGKNPAFTRQFNAKFKARDSAGCLDLAKKMCSQPYVLNSIVRKVLTEEAGTLTQGARKTPPTTPTRTTSMNQTHTRPYQDGKRWFYPSGKPMSYEEVLAGKHLA